MDMYASCATNSGGWWIGFLLSWGLNREETMFPMQALFLLIFLLGVAPTSQLLLPTSKREAKITDLWRQFSDAQRFPRRNVSKKKAGVSTDTEAVFKTLTFFLFFTICLSHDVIQSSPDPFHDTR